MSVKNKLELYILKGMLKYVDYVAKFQDKMKPEFFTPEVAANIIAVKRYYTKYSKLPSIEIICDSYLPKICKDKPELIELAEDTVQESLAIQFEKDHYDIHFDWLVEETKDFLKKKNVEIALMEAAELLQANKNDEAVKRVMDASQLSFDDNLGLDYMEDIDKRIDKMKEKNSVIPTGIASLDRNIGGGWHEKSLNIFGAGTNVGKTLILGAVATNLIQQGKNGLYITLEINDYLLANRIDANIADINLNDLAFNADKLKETLKKKYDDADASGHPFGRFIIKEYPPSTINAQAILAIVRELEMKKNGFKPDFICVDYLGLLIPNGKSFSESTYGRLKTVAEELRAIASILGVPVFTAVQTNRESFNQKDIGLQHTSDSIGIPQTADLMIMVSRDAEMEAANLMWWNIAKSRYSKNGIGFKIKVDYPHMRISDCGDDIENRADEAASLIDDLANQKKDLTNSNKAFHAFNNMVKGA